MQCTDLRSELFGILVENPSLFRSQHGEMREAVRFVEQKVDES